MERIKARCFGFTRLPSPSEKTHNLRSFFALVDADDFFNLDNWRKINIRDPKATGRIPAKIKESLLQNDLFHLINRGIILSVKDAHYDNQSNNVEIVLEDNSVHGLLDGGHTYLQLKKFKETPKDERGFELQMVKVEIITGLNREWVVEVADGRNTSTPVKEQSIDELNEEYEPIKQALRGRPYQNLIAYKEYEELNGKPKPISVVDILKCLVSLDRDGFTDEKHPTQKVTRDNETLDYYRDPENQQKLKKLLPLLPDALVLWDTIQANFVPAYKTMGGDAGKIGERDNKFFKKTSRKRLYFIDQDATYTFPDSLRLPVFAAFRAIVKRDKNGSCSWAFGINPSEFFIEEVGGKLTKVVCENLKETQDVTKTTRTESVWESCYDKVRLAMAEKREEVFAEKV